MDFLPGPGIALGFEKFWAFAWQPPYNCVSLWLGKGGQIRGQGWPGYCVRSSKAKVLVASCVAVCSLPLEFNSDRRSQAIYHCSYAHSHMGCLRLVLKGLPRSFQFSLIENLDQNHFFSPYQQSLTE